MTIYYVNTGSGPNAGNGDSLRVAFNKINANFSAVEQQFTDIAQGSTSSISNGSYFVSLQPDGNLIYHTTSTTYQYGNEFRFSINADATSGGSIDTFTGGNFSIGTNAHDHVWTFTYDGQLIFPDNTVQTTAYTGQNVNTGNWHFNGNNQYNGNGGNISNSQGAGTSTAFLFMPAYNNSTTAISLQNHKGSVGIVSSNGTHLNRWTFDKVGTITTPLPITRSFTAVLDSDHMTNPSPSVGLTDAPWQFEVHFVISQDGQVETQINNIFPILTNPGYVSGYAFSFTEADHGIPGYTFTITLNNIQYPGGAGYTANIAVSPPPAYPSTVRSQGAIKLTSDSANWVFGTDSKLTLPQLIGVPTSITLVTGHPMVGYTTGTYTTYVNTGSGTGMTVDVLETDGYNITSIAINQPGYGYTQGQHVYIDGGTGTGEFTVDSVSNQASTVASFGDINLTASTSTWAFNQYGALTFPQGTVLGTADGPGAFIIDGAVDKDVLIYTYNGPTAHGWTFGTDGTLTVPGDIQDANGSVIRIATTSTAPARADGQLWFNNTEGRLYIKDNGVWVDANPTVIPPPSTYLDEITVEGSTFTINGSSLTIDESGTLLVNGTQVTGGSAPAGPTDRLTSSTSVVRLASDNTLYLPGDNQVSKLSFSEAQGAYIGQGMGTLELRTGPSAYLQIQTDGGNTHWQFGADGSLAFPTAGAEWPVTEYYVPTLIGKDQINFSTYNAGNSTSSYAVSTQDNKSWEVFAEDDSTQSSGWAYLRVELPTIDNPTVFIQNRKGSNGITHTWTFDANGKLTIPGDIQDDNGSVIRVARTSTAPTRADGQLWFNNAEGRLYIKDNGVWVDTNPTVIPPPSTYLDDITVEGSTFTINGSTLTIDSTGTLLVNGGQVTGGSSGNVGFEYATIQEGSGGPGGSVTSITGNHGDGLSLTSDAWAQLMWVPDTRSVTIGDIADGGAVYNWAFAESAGFRIENKTISTSSRTWLFDTTGNIELPAHGDAAEGVGRIQSLNGYPTLMAYGSFPYHGGPELDWMDSDSPDQDFFNNTTTRHSLYINDNGLYVGINENNVAGMTQASFQFNPNGNILISKSTTATVSTFNDFAISTDKGSSTKTWTFGLDGTLTVPGTIDTNGQLVSGYSGALDLNVDGSVVLSGTPGQDAVIQTSATGNSSTSTWTFGTDGDLTLAGNIKSTTIPQVGLQLSTGEPNFGYGGIRACFSGNTFTGGSFSDIQVGWIVTGPNGFTDIVAALNDIGGGFITLTNQNWPGQGPYTFSSPNYAPAYSNNLQIETGSASWNFNTGGQLSNNDDGYLSLRGSSLGPTSRIHIRNTDNDPTSDVNIHLQTGTGGDIFEIFQLGGGASVPYTGGLRTNSATAPILIQTNNGGTSTSTWTFGTDGTLTLPNGSMIGETSSTAVITPPTANPGQSLVVRPTSSFYLSASGYIVPGENLIITLTNSNNAAVDNTYINYTITDAVASQLGLTSLTGHFPYLSPSATNPQSASIVLPIPLNSSALTFTLTIDSDQPGGSANVTITVTNNDIVNNELSHIHLVAGDPSVVDLYLGDDDQYVKIEKNQGNVVIGTTNFNGSPSNIISTWTFGIDGTLTLPGPINNISAGTHTATGSGDPVYPTALDLNKTINKLGDNTGSRYTLADGVEGQIMYLVRQHNVTDMSLGSIGIVVANGYQGLNVLPNQTLYFGSDMITLIFTDGAWQQSGGIWD
jgi:hypothetical protein